MEMMSTHGLAPVGISVYARLDHFKICIEAFQPNDLALQTDLYVFSDAPKLGDESEIKLLCKEFGFTAGMLKRSLAEGRKKN